jgi:hypothetical protein
MSTWLVEFVAIFKIYEQKLVHFHDHATIISANILQVEILLNCDGMEVCRADSGTDKSTRR